MISMDITVWITAILYICFLSQLIRRNYAYLFSEYLLVGLGAGIAFVMAVETLLGTSKVQLVVNQNYFFLVALLLGVGLFGRLIKGYGWVGRWPIAIMVGVGMAIATRGTIEAEILHQIYPTITGLIKPGDIFGTFNGILIFIGMISSIFYFLYFTKYEGTKGRYLGKLAYMGRCFMMLFFGASIGQMYVWRATYLIGVFRHLLGTWLGL